MVDLLNLKFATFTEISESKHLYLGYVVFSICVKVKDHL